MSRVEEIVVPDIGDFQDVPVIEIAVSPGDRVVTEDPLVTLESDKATMDVPSPTTGIVKEMKVKLGDTVSEGSLILTLEVNDAAASEAASKPAAEPPSPPPAAPVPPAAPRAPAATAPAPPAGGGSPPELSQLAGPAPAETLAIWASTFLRAASSAASIAYAFSNAARVASSDAVAVAGTKDLRYAAASPGAAPCRSKSPHRTAARVDRAAALSRSVGIGPAASIARRAAGKQSSRTA